MTVWLDGEWCDDLAAGCRGDDRGLLLGDGLFETLRLKRSELVRAGAHIERLTASCAALGLECPLDAGALAAITDELADRDGLTDAAIRLTLTAGPAQRGLSRGLAGRTSCRISAAACAPPPHHISLATSPVQRSPSSFAARHKTLSYIDNVEARRQAQQAGADMALLLDTNGHLSGADCANLFWVSDGVIFTPSLDCAVLPGTVRGALMAAFNVEQGRFTASTLSDATCVFVTNALLGAVTVSGIDGRQCSGGDGVPDEVVALLNGA